MYPRKGQSVTVYVHWGNTVKTVQGIFTGKVFRARSGAVLGVIETEKGIEYVPWTSDKRIVEFQVHEERCPNSPVGEEQRVLNPIMNSELLTMKRNE
ncbi:hypothetical protein [Candidatus Caldatribacterium sp.]|uniref:hypothetical protein n=1 Tax=Candidatus Caldatribacterium sp. TaxID=2282143 RepID=UPI0038480069|nr:hypothetical protein [Candidatus Caldatribacterium sp.]